MNLKMNCWEEYFSFDRQLARPLLLLDCSQKMNAAENVSKLYSSLPKFHFNSSKLAPTAVNWLHILIKVLFSQLAITIIIDGNGENDARRKMAFPHTLICSWRYLLVVILEFNFMYIDIPNSNSSSFFFVLLLSFGSSPSFAVIYFIMMKQLE